MLSAPKPPAQRAAPRVPWVSIALPLLLAGLFSLVWSSPYALLIGVLAPTLALGHWIESLRRHRNDAEDQEDSYQRANAEWENAVIEECRDYRHRTLAARPHPEQWRDAGLPPQLFDADAPPGRLLIDGELTQAFAPPLPLVRTEWVAEATCSSMLSSAVISGNPSEIGPQPEGVPVIAAHESDRHVAEIDRAYRQ